MFDYLTQPQIQDIFGKYGVKRAALFGSYAKQAQNGRSDVDILVQFGEGQTPSYFKMYDFETELEKQLGKKVDLVTFNALHQFIRDEVIKTMQIFYEK